MKFQHRTIQSFCHIHLFIKRTIKWFCLNNLPQQNQFVDQVKGAMLVSFDAKHEIYSSEDSVLEEYYNTVLDFLKG